MDSNFDILQFYAFSANHPAGDGVGDVVKNKSDYVNLNDITNWRRMFSSLWSEDPFYVPEYTIGGRCCGNRSFTSYEHAYQYMKFALAEHPI